MTVGKWFNNPNETAIWRFGVSVYIFDLKLVCLLVGTLIVVPRHFVFSCQTHSPSFHFHNTVLGMIIPRFLRSAVGGLKFSVSAPTI